MFDENYHHSFQSRKSIHVAHIQRSTYILRVEKLICCGDIYEEYLGVVVVCLFRCKSVLVQKLLDPLEWRSNLNILSYRYYKYKIYKTIIVIILQWQDQISITCTLIVQTYLNHLQFSQFRRITCHWTLKKKNKILFNYIIWLFL